MPDYKLLRREIDDDPLGLGYAGMTAAQLAASLNGLTRPGNVPVKDIVRYLVVSRRYGILKIAAEGDPDPGKRALCLDVVRILDGGEFEDLDVRSATVGAFIAALKAASLLDDSGAAAIVGLGEKRQTRGMEIGWGLVTDDDIARVTARGGAS